MPENSPDTAEEDKMEHFSELDVRKKQVFHGRYLFCAPGYDDLLGALSLIIWTITLIVSLKYVVIVLRADDEGEGGTFAIYSLLSRYVWIPFCTRSMGRLMFMASGKHRPQRSKRRAIGGYASGLQVEQDPYNPGTEHLHKDNA
ncbi:MAG: hypothetical protein Q9196_004184 [Gyalolechia fulgens]